MHQKASMKVAFATATGFGGLAGMAASFDDTLMTGVFAAGAVIVIGIASAGALYKHHLDKLNRSEPNPDGPR